MGAIFRKLIAVFLPGTIEVGEAADRIRDDLSRQMAEDSPAAAEVDALAVDAGETLERCRSMNPSAFDRRRDRRIDDPRPGEPINTDGLVVTEYRFDGLILGNDDIVCERGEGSAE